VHGFIGAVFHTPACLQCLCGVFVVMEICAPFPAGAGCSGALFHTSAVGSVCVGFCSFQNVRTFFLLSAWFLQVLCPTPLFVCSVCVVFCSYGNMCTFPCWCRVSWCLVPHFCCQQCLCGGGFVVFKTCAPFPAKCKALQMLCSTPLLVRSVCVVFCSYGNMCTFPR